MNAALIVLLLLAPLAAAAEIVEYPGNPDVLPDERFVRVVSEEASPVQQTYIKARDGVYIAAAIRKPRGRGPFPALVMFHGAPGGRGMEQLVGWSRGDHGGPVWERFLEEGFVVVVADYRGGAMNVMNTPSANGLTTAIDDGISVIEHVQGLDYVNADRVSVYGVSLGGNLALFLASKVPSLHAVVVGAPAPIWFLGATRAENGTDLANMRHDPAIADANIGPIRTPVLLQIGTADFLLDLNKTLHAEMVDRGKPIRMEIYEHGYHDFVLGNQGHERQNLPNGEALLQGALDALDRSVQFVKSGKFAEL